MSNFYARWKQWQYYVIIGVVSLVALLFLPMIGSEAELNWKLPNTAVGWIVYVFSKLLVAVLNILIFHCFILQGKLNIESNEKYIEANRILEVVYDLKELAPKSPSEWKRNAYGKKGVTIFITSMLSAIGLTQAVLSFDWLSMLTYLFTVLMGIIFGILQMNATEVYWTTEYPQYAQRVKKQSEDRKALEMAKKELTEQIDDSSDPIRRAIILESIDSDRAPSTDN